MGSQYYIYLEQLVEIDLALQITKIICSSKPRFLYLKMANFSSKSSTTPEKTQTNLY